MYRLLDLSQTSRHIKIENTFSTKKYSIYYAHDPQTLQTYLTKVITNKDDVVNYYKAHINQNVLPYLQLKRQHKGASILTLSAEQGEAIIKINQQEKMIKIDEIQSRMKGNIEVLRYYEHFHHNQIFEQQLNLIKEFIEKFESQDKQLNEKIHEIMELQNSLQQLMSFINNIKIDNPNILKKLQNLRRDGDELQLQDLNNFVSFIQDIMKKLEREKIKEEYLKSDELNRLKNDVYKCSQTLIKIRSNLQNPHHSSPASQIEYFYEQLIKQEQLLKQQQRKIYQSNVLYVTKKLIKGMTLREMIVNKDPRLTPDFCYDLTKTLVDFIFMYGGVKDLFITTENIIVEDCGTFHLNYFSFVGLQFIKLKKYVSKSDFLEILPYIDTDYLVQSCKNAEIGMSTKVLLRFIIVNFVSAFLKKDIIYDAKSIDFQPQVKIDDIIQDVTKIIQGNLLFKVLSNGQIDKIKDKFDKVYGVNYSELVKCIFKQKSLKIEWQEIFSKLSKQSIISTILKAQDGKEDQEKKIFNFHNVAKKYQPNSNLKNQEFYVIQIAFMEAIDHYINILQVLTKQYPFKQTLDNLKPKQKEKINKMAMKMIYERKTFQKKGWYTKQIYVPVKTAMTFTQILDHYNWVDMLHSETRQNLQTLKGVQNLLSFMLQLQEYLVLIQPLLNDDLLEMALSREQCNYYYHLKQQGNIETYNTLLHKELDDKERKKKKERIKERKAIIEAGESQKQDDEEDEDEKDNRSNLQLLSSNESSEQDNERYNFKATFWKYFFSIWKVICNLIKNYYIRINQVPINEVISITGGKFTQWVREFNPTTPPMSINPM